MLALVIYLISISYSNISFDGTTLKITDEESITNTKISQYAAATSFVYNSFNLLSIDDRAFANFASLISINIKCSDLHFGHMAFEDSSEIINITIESDTIDSDSYVFQPSNKVYYEFKGSSFDYHMTSFIFFELSEINIDSSDVNMVIMDNQQKYFNRIIIHGTDVNIRDFAFLKSSKELELIQINADYLYIGHRTFFGANINEIQIDCNYFNISEFGFTSCNIDQMKINTYTIESGHYSFSGATINNFIISENEVILNSDSDINPRITNKFKLETSKNFSSSYIDVILAMPREIFIKCGGSCDIRPHSEYYHNFTIENITIYADSDIIFGSYSIDNSKVKSLELNANGSIIFDKKVMDSQENVTSLVLNANGSISFDKNCFRNSTFNSIVINSNNYVNFSRLFDDGKNIFNNIEILNCKNAIFRIII